VEVLYQYWPSAIAVAVAALTFLPGAWTKRIRLAIAGLKLPDFNGPDTATDAARTVVETKARIRAEIEAKRKEIEVLETDLRNCDALVLKGDA
jgi:hypothetical protein